MLVGFLVLLLGFWIGEAGSAAFSLPVPGAVLGMAALVVLLGLRRRTPVELERAADGLLSHLPLLFVPAGVGVMQFAAPLRADWLPVVLTLFGGTLLTVAVTALSLRAFVALQGKNSTRAGAP